MIERSFQLFLLMKSYQVVNHTYFLAIAVHIEGETALPALRGLIYVMLIHFRSPRGFGAYLQAPAYEPFFYYPPGEQ